MKLLSHKHDAGLFSQINFVLTQIEALGHADFYVDWTKGTPYDQADGTNVFDCLFVQPFLPETRGPEVTQWPHHRYTGESVDKLYFDPGQWRWDLNDCWNLLKVQPTLLQQVDGFCANLAADTVALHVRNLHIGSECPDKTAPTLENYAQALAAHTGPVFLATDNAEAVAFFQSRLGPRLVTREINRAPDMQEEYHLKFPQSIIDVQNCLIDALIMARCAHLIHSVSNIATAVLVMNPRMDHTYIRKGQALQRPAQPRDLLRQKVRTTIKQSQPEMVLYLKQEAWRDWLLIYPGNVCKRHTAEWVGTFSYAEAQQLELRWIDRKSEIYLPISAAGITVLSDSHAIYYKLKVRPKIIVDLKDGMANQLFLYACGIALAKAWGADLVAAHPGAGRPYGLGYYGIKLTEKLPAREFEISWHGNYEEGVEQELLEDVLATSADTLWLEGYFQNERFFSSVADTVRKLFFRPQPLPDWVGAGTPVAVHVRLGDYVNSRTHAPLPPSYFADAMDLMRTQIPNPVFLVFSDNPEHCGAFVGSAADTHILPLMNEFATMSMMQACRAFIIANSTFSWWAAWLSGVTEVICPERFLPHQTWTICPERWTHLPVTQFWNPALATGTNAHAERAASGNR